MKRITFDLLTCASLGLFYLLNRLCLIPGTDGAVHWFLSCYANDLCAGAVILAWLDLLLHWGHLSPLSSWKIAVPFLLFCGLFWEVLSPLWRPGAVCGFRDFLAYQIGGALWLYLVKRRDTSKKPSVSP